MNNKNIELINKIVEERKKIELLKERLERLEDKYHEDLVKLYCSIDIFGKEKEVENETNNIISFQEHKKRLYKGIIIDDD